MEFDAQLVRTFSGEQGLLGVILDRTCFYPTGGGQPCDLGHLDGREVLNVEERDGDVVHWVQGVVHGPSVHGKVLWGRRFDHMQQHTGQHILSAAFEKLFGAATVGFHLGEESCTIDLDRPSWELEELHAVEDLANQAVYSDHPIIARFVMAEELSALLLRKPPHVDHDIRIVEVPELDLIPCGGTHCARSGEVGSIVVRRWERRGQETRVEFLCGWRALRDYRWKNAAVTEMAHSFSVKDQELPGAIQRLADEAAESRRQVSRLQEVALGYEAEALVAAAPRWRDSAIVVEAYPDRDPQEVRRLALRLSQGTATVILLGTGGVQARLFFARTPDLAMDMSSVLKETCQAVGGSGGGASHFAQGGGLPGVRLSEALETGRAVIIRS